MYTIKLKDIYKEIYSSIIKTIEKSKEAESIAYIIIERYLKQGKINILLNQHVSVTEEQEALLNTAIDKVNKHEPIQYIIGETSFMNRQFIVNKNVLIPRQETEYLVNKVIKEFSNQENIKILDIGTGSGCIAITLKKELKSSYIDAIDISKKSLEIARLNADILNADINFIQMDILNQKFNNNNIKYDIIISNPPYVLESEKNYIDNNVIQYEPHLAIFVEDQNPLIFYKKITAIALNHLKTNGKLYFEINEIFGKQIKQILQNENFANIKVEKDLNEKDRYITAQLDLK